MQVAGSSYYLQETYSSESLSGFDAFKPNFVGPPEAPMSSGTRSDGHYKHLSTDQTNFGASKVAKKTTGALVPL